MRDYRLLIFAYTTSALGNCLYQLTLPLLVLKLTGSALTTGAVYAVEFLPYLLFSLPGGVLADRIDRRLMLVVGDTASALLAVLLAVVVTVSAHTIWLIFVVAFLLASVNPIYHPAFQSYIPDVTPREKLPQCNSWLQTGDNAMSLIGPVIAGSAIGLLGYQATIYADAGTFMISAAAITLVRFRAGRRQQDETDKRLAGLVSDVREAGAYIFRRNPVLLAGALMFAGTNFAIWLVSANFVFYLTHYRHLSPSLIGVVFGAQGVGAIVGSAIAASVIRRIPPGRAIVLCTGLAGATTATLIVFRGVPEITFIWGALAGLSAVNVVSWFSLRQQIVPGYLLGRVVATTRMLGFLTLPLGAVVAGLLQTTLNNIYLIIGLAAGIRLLMAILASRSALGRAAVPPIGAVSDTPRPEVDVASQVDVASPVEVAPPVDAAVEQAGDS